MNTWERLPRRQMETRQRPQTNPAPTQTPQPHGTHPNTPTPDRIDPDQKRAPGQTPNHMAPDQTNVSFACITLCPMARPHPAPLTVRLADETRAELVRRATAEGLTVSAIVRRALASELEPTR